VAAAVMAGPRPRGWHDEASMSEYPTGTGHPRPTQEGTLQQGKAAAREVAGTAKDRTAQVADEAKVQTRRARGCVATGLCPARVRPEPLPAAHGLARCLWASQFW
jgi:hypothetical protein